MRLICPACGMNLEVVDGTPLGVVRCPECGKRLDLRQAFGLAEPDVPTAEPAALAWDVGPAAPRRPAGRRRRNRWPAAALVAAGVAGGGGVALAVWLAASTAVPTPAADTATPTTTAPDAGAADLVGLKTAADAAAFRGDYRAAYDGYTRVLVAAARRPAADRLTAEVAAGARLGQDRVSVALMEAGRTAAVPPTVDVPVPVPRWSRPPAAAAAVDDDRRPAFPRAAADERSPARDGNAPAAADATAAGADAAVAVADPPKSPRDRGDRTYAAASAVTDAEIGDAIARGIYYLRSQYRDGEVMTGLPDRAAGAGGAIRPGPGGGPRAGPAAADLSGNDGVPGYTGGSVDQYDGTFSTPGFDALCTYALLHAGRSVADPELAPHGAFTEAILRRLKRYRLAATYHRSLRASALAVYHRPDDHAALEADVAALVRGHAQGGYTYGDPSTVAGQGGLSQRGWDNSNSQYGLLGVWSGAQVGIGVPDPYWRAIAAHWSECASPQGTWGYLPEQQQPYLAMTCAGVASMLVARDYMAAVDANRVAGGPKRTLATVAPPPRRRWDCLDHGLQWMDEGDNAVGVAGASWYGYTLYGLERVGLASGYKFFGDHDWYAELAGRAVAEQRADGSWGTGQPGTQTLMETAYHLLFLARGRHPLLFNKLRYDGGWDNRPDDVAHLAKYASDQLERPLNWQVANLRRNWWDWADAPVLFVAGDGPPKQPFTDRDVDALRDFCFNGGLIVTHADGGNPAFDAWARQLAARLFPDLELQKVGRDDPLYSVLYRLADPKPLLAVSNGSRLLMVHCPADIAGGWQLNWTDARKADFQLGMNLFVYAAGKTDYHNRLSSTYVPECPDHSANARAVGRLRYAGGWDPEPYAWTRFARTFEWDAATRLDVQPTDLRELGGVTPRQMPAAFLTGAVRQDFSADEAAAARQYVEAGGVLVIDSCGGQAPFDQSVRKTLLAVAFPGAAIGPLPADHPLRVPSRPLAEDLRGPLRLRPFAAEQLGTSTCPLEGLHVGRGWVILSKLDLTTGLLGTQSWGIRGYDPAYAQAVVRNAILWAADRQGAGVVAAGRRSR